jgi:hypothetical protein
MISAYDVAHIGEISRCRQVAHSHHRFLEPRFDAGNLTGESRNDEARGLAWASVVEGADPHDRNTVSQMVLEPQEVLRYLADSVWVIGAEWATLCLRQILWFRRSIFLVRADDQELDFAS